MLHLILSPDYGVFGNGSGDVRRDMIEPIDRLLSLRGAFPTHVHVQDKGQMSMLRAFTASIRDGGSSCIPADRIFAVTRATLAQ